MLYVLYYVANYNYPLQKIRFFNLIFSWLVYGHWTVQSNTSIATHHIIFNVLYVHLHEIT